MPRYRSPITAFVHTTIGLFFVSLVTALAGCVLATISALFGWLPLMWLPSAIFGVAATLTAAVATTIPMLTIWQVIAARAGLWRVECALGTTKNHWEWRAWWKGAGRWGIGVDVLGYRLDVYTVKENDQ